MTASSLGVPPKPERDQRYLEIARKAIPKLAAYQNGTPPPYLEDQP
jgi:hypothetical protein